MNENIRLLLERARQLNSGHDRQIELFMAQILQTTETGDATDMLAQSLAEPSALEQLSSASVEPASFPVATHVNFTSDKVDENTAFQLLFAAADWFEKQTGASVGLVLKGEMFPTFGRVEEQRFARKEKPKAAPTEHFLKKIESPESVAATQSIDDILITLRINFRERDLFNIKTQLYFHLYRMNEDVCVPLRILHQTIIEWKDIDEVFDEKFKAAVFTGVLYDSNGKQTTQNFLPLTTALQYIHIASIRPDIGLRNFKRRR